MTINANVRSMFADFMGKPCCRQRVGEWRTLSIGFGARVPHTSQKSVDSFYGEWEIGTWSAAWRILHGTKVLCGSKDLVDSTEELDKKLQNVHLGRILDIENLSPLDVRVTLDDGVYIDFICVSDIDDEMFHIFAPNDLYIEFKDARWNFGNTKKLW